jgi:hypothetical protein
MYLGRPYHPVWLDNLADDVTSEAAAMEGTAHGPEEVRSIILTAKSIYVDQEFSFTGNFGEDGFIEEYTTHILGEPASVVVTVHRNAAGKTQHIVVNHRPRSAVLLFARVMGEKFAGTPLARFFITEPSK